MVGSSKPTQVVGELKILACLCLVSLFLLSFSTIMPVLANIPTVLNIEATKEGADTALSIEISHSSPSSTHYVDMIEVEVNERLDRVSNLEPQTTTTFTYEHNVGTVEYETIRVRAHCTDHGWSPWATMGALPEPSFIETPIGMVTLAGAAVAVVVVVFVVLRRTGKA